MLVMKAESYKCEACGFENEDGNYFVMFQGERLVCASVSDCDKRKAGADPSEAPVSRDYLEVKLYFKGGSVVVGCVEKLESKTNGYGRYSNISWTNTKWDDLPTLTSVALDELQAITSTKKVRDE